MFDFTLIQKADLSPADLARLIKFKGINGEEKHMSRPAVYRWVYGTTIPNDSIRHTLSIVLKNIARATEAGALPLPINTPRAVRKKLIDEAVTKYSEPY